MIDWEFAQQTAGKLVRPGPEVSTAEVAEAVQELREGAARSEAPVREFSDLHAKSATAPVLVVDRERWVAANLDGFKQIMAPLAAKLETAGKMPSGLSRSIGSKVTGAELGALMAFMSTKVLGQFDPFWAGGANDTGRMLLVAPNIVHAERQLKVDPHDFRLWVCLHEETHRVQFTAVPWMRDHIHGEIASLIGSVEVDPAKLAGLIGEGAKRVVDMIRGDDSDNLLELIQSAEQKQ